MTKNILESDIVFAKGLMSGDRPDAEIVTALTRRGVEPGAAARLVDDLRNGRPVQPEMVNGEWVLEQKRARRSAARAAAQVDSTSPPTAPGAETEPTPRQERSKSDSAKPKKKWGLWMFTFLLIGLTAATGFVVAKKFWTPDTIEARERQPTPKELAQNRQTLPPKSLVIEIRPDGLQIGGSPMTRESALQSVSRFLGAPTRTNQITGGNKVVYAYDRHGVLVYSDAGGVSDSIVLDFDGTGGINGANSPFIGKLQVEDHAVRAETDSKTLTSIKQLGLKGNASDAGIFGGKCQGIEMIFAYLKTPARLSLVEINLK